MDRIQSTQLEAVKGLLAEMILDEAVRKYKINCLYLDIDRALEKGDEPLFLQLTNELKSLQTYENAV